MKKGSKMTKEQRKNISEAHKGQIPWNKGKKGLQVAWNKGKKWNEWMSKDGQKIAKKNLTAGGWCKGMKGLQLNTGRTHFKKGHIPWCKGLTGLPPTWIAGKKHSEESRKKISEANKGRKHSEETKRKRSLAQKGNKGSNWQGGITQKSIILRCSYKYREWRTKVFTRDNFTCQECFQYGGELEAHHIKRFSKFKELRFKLDNGITLCKPCHKKKHKPIPVN